MSRITTAFLAAVLLGVASVEVVFLYTEGLTLSQAWFLLLLIGLGTLTLAAGGRSDTVTVACLLLASLSVLFSAIDPEELALVDRFPARLLVLFWRGLLCVFPFAFVHFSLIFPVTSNWLERQGRRLWILYAPFLVLLTLTLFEGTGRVAELLLLAMFPVGLILGMLIFISQYRFSLTMAEKSRLRIVLIGCLAGGLPTFLSTLDRSLLPASLHEMARLLLPIFPIFLVLAVLAENLPEILRRHQTLLVYSVAASGGASVFFLIFLIFPVFSDPAPPLFSIPFVSSIALALLLIYPFKRLAVHFLSRQLNTDTTAVGSGEPSPPGNFQTIQPNPYIVGNPVHSSEMFFGREEEFQFIRSKLRTSAQGSVVVLWGDRRTGKTSILYQIREGRLGPAFLPVFVDMQAMVVGNDVEFLQALADALTQSGEGTTRPAPLPRVGSYLDFSAFLSSLLESSQGHWILMLDEYELIEDKVTAHKLSAEIFLFLNSLLERHPGLSLVLAGSRDLESNSAWSSLLGKAVYRQLGFLHYKDATRLISEPLRGKAFFQPQAISLLLRLCHGHPFYTQVLCQTIVDALNEMRHNEIDAAVVDESVRRVIEHAPPQLLYEWAGFSNSQKVVLSALAGLLRNSRNFVSSDQIEGMIRSLPKLHRHVDGIEIRTQLEALRRRLMLDRDQTRYRFHMDLYRLWLQQEHDIWNVLHEISGESRHSAGDGVEG